MNKIPFSWMVLLLLLPRIVHGEVMTTREDQWLRAVIFGIELHARANNGALPSSWEEIAARNPRGIEGATKDFVRDRGYSPLQVYGLLPQPQPLPTRPSHVVIMVRTAELSKSWKNEEGQRESKVYRTAIFRYSEGHILCDNFTAWDWASLKPVIDSLEPLKTSEAGFSEELAIAHAAFERQASASETAASGAGSDAAPREANARGGGGHTRRASYVFAGVIGILSAAFGGLITWALSRRSAANE